LPIYPGISFRKLNFIIDTIKAFFKVKK